MTDGFRQFCQLLVRFRAFQGGKIQCGLGRLGRTTNPASRLPL
jgi:hypothetical protein